ncbi:MAG: hypothetical protein DMG49_05290 [Acidobacteria bacterium]|nr:MAG: hypothetical protein DMG49_05290 [Acidobacteriota bacterium]
MTEPRIQANPAERTSPDLTGTTVGRFIIRKWLGQGGMGEVYFAEDVGLKRSVALKRIPWARRADERSRRRLWHEAQLASQLNDPHIAAVYDVIEDGDELFVVMEYVEGQTLRRRLDQPLHMHEFLAVAEECAGALIAAHGAGILHGDIKPENIMLTPAGQVKILDFGIAHRLEESESSTTLETLPDRKFAGTLAYMSPEVLETRESDARADIFSLGVVFYEALAGRNPFLAEGFLPTCERILHEDPPLLREVNSNVSTGLERIISKMLVKNPAERYATATDLAADLRALPSVTVHSQTPAPSRWPAAKHRRVTRRVGGLSLVVLVVATLLPSVRQQARSWLGLNSVPRTKQVAVLPFSVVGTEGEMAAFGAGLTETLTAKLTQLTEDRSLQVVPASEIRARRITTVDDARKGFGVNLALGGSLCVSGDHVRIYCVLVDASKRRQIRAGSLTVAAKDPFTALDGVVREAVRMLELDVQPRQREALESHGTQVVGAYDYYLQGRGYLQNYDRAENLENAIQVFERALSLDPSYALAYAGLGDAYWKKYESNKESKWIENSRIVCQQALRLDKQLSPAHVCMGTLYGGTGAYQDAVREFGRGEAEKTYRHAIELRPHYWAPYNWLGAFYFRQARYQEAAEMFSQVVALAPDSFRGYSNLGASYVESGRYAEAIAALERSIVIRPTDYGYTNLGNAFFYQRQYEQAVHAHEKAVKLTPRDPLLWWNLGDAYYWTPGQRDQATYAYRQAIALAKEELRVNPRDIDVFGILGICQAMLGDKKSALESIHSGLHLSPEHASLRFQAAVVYAQFGQSSEAIEWLKKALSAGLSPSRVRDTPNFDPLRADPRFQESLRMK